MLRCCILIVLEYVIVKNECKRELFLSLLVKPSLFCNDWVDLCGNKEKLLKRLSVTVVPTSIQFLGPVSNMAYIFVNVRATLKTDKKPWPWEI